MGEAVPFWVATTDSLSLLLVRKFEKLRVWFVFTSSLPLLSFPSRPKTFLKPFVLLKEKALLLEERVDEALSFPKTLFGSEGDNGE